MAGKWARSCLQDPPHDPGRAVTDDAKNGAAEPAAKPAWRLKAWLYGALTAMAAAFVAYGVAYFDGRHALSAAEAQILAGAREHAGERAAWARREQELTLDRGRLMARRELHQGLMALEERNFGTATAHLQSAAAALAANSAGDTALRELSERVGAFRVTATEEIGEQRTTLVGFIQLLDKALDAGHP